MRPFPKRMATALLGSALFLGCSGTDTTTAVVSGKTVFRKMAVEEVEVTAYPLDGGDPGSVVRGRSGYHGSFTLRLMPGNYRLVGKGSLPHRDRGAMPLTGSVAVEVPPGARRVDRVVLPLKARQPSP